MKMKKKGYAMGGMKKKRLRYGWHEEENESWRWH